VTCCCQLLLQPQDTRTLLLHDPQLLLLLLLLGVLSQHVACHVPLHADGPQHKADTETVLHGLQHSCDDTHSIDNQGQS
jgi:hypothetical protein